MLAQIVDRKYETPALLSVVRQAFFTLPIGLLESYGLGREMGFAVPVLFSIREEAPRLAESTEWVVPFKWSYRCFNSSLL